MSERWIITPEGGRPLVLPLTHDDGAQVVGIQTPSPPRRVAYAPRPEGATPTTREWENREITLQLALVPPRDEWAGTTHDFGAPAPHAEGDGDLPGWTGSVRRAGPDGNATLPMVTDLTAAIAAVAASGGLVRRVLDDGTWLDFDVLDAEISDGPTWDVTYYAAGATTMTVKLTCAPFGRGRERLLAEGTKAAGRRFLTLEGLTVPGDVAALARIELRDGGPKPHRTALFSIDQPSEQSSATGLQFDAVSLDRPGGVVEPSTFPGALAPQAVWRKPSSVAVKGDVWQPCVYLRRGGVPLAVDGQYRVFARVIADPSRDTQLRLRWSPGTTEGGLIPNPPVRTTTGLVATQTALTLGWSVVDLGQVYIPAGHSLDGVIERAYSLAADQAYTVFDQIYLVPTSRFARAYAATASPSRTLVRGDHQDDAVFGTPPVIVGSKDVTGATWEEPFQGTGGGNSAGTVPVNRGGRLYGLANNTFAQRAFGVPAPVNTQTTSVTALLSGTWSYAAVWAGDALGARIVAYNNSTSPPPAGQAVAIRGLVQAVTSSSASGDMTSAQLVLDYTSGDGIQHRSLSSTVTAGALVELELDISGKDAVLRLFDYYRNPLKTLVVADIGQIRPADTSTMRAGFQLGASAGFCEYRQFAVLAPETQPDAVLYPGGTTTLATDRATRTTPAGRTGPVAAYLGDRPLLPPSGSSNRPVRVQVGTSHTDLRAATDQDVDQSFTGRVFATPRYLQIPDENA